MRAVLIFFIILSTNLYSQEYKYIKMVSGVSISSKIKNEMLYIKWENINNEKVEVGFENLIWSTGTGAFIAKQNGGTFTLKAKEIASGDFSGSFWNVPKGYDGNSLNFKLDGIEVNFPDREKPVSPSIQNKIPLSNNTSNNSSFETEKIKQQKLENEERLRLTRIENERKTREIEDNYANQLQQTQNYINQSNVTLQKNSEIVSQAFDEAKNTINEIYEKKKAREEIAEKQKEEKRLIAKRDKEIAALKENQRLAEIEAEIRNEQILNEEKIDMARKEAEVEMLTRKDIFGKFFNYRRNFSEVDEKINTVYFLKYQRFFDKNEIIIKLYKVNRYSDGTWPLLGDIGKKINIDPNQSNVSVDYNYQLLKSEELLGFFLEKQLNDFMDLIINSADIYIPGVAVQIHTDKYGKPLYEEINPITTSKNFDNDFWKN
ncbi:hypothetical protein [Flavobacterium dankookense]|uniref:Uncharacterized protein n=1 Tax=Flavobacterium dankookense TaxID=706186 RepID=A0A4V3CSM1_9FLAO|nr:hypothetical protein [Flavobacterium dankookense]TDP61042.1 hypothetical protein BC748_0650 [Flavobacterium dankookense]